MTAPIYREKYAEPSATRVKELYDVAESLKEHCPHDLYVKLLSAIHRVDESSKAVKSISKGGRIVGYGVNRAEKAIACDNLISIVKQIKALKAW